MAYISFQPKDNYFTKTYTGNDSTQTFTDIGFEPAMVWVKNAVDTYNHQLHLAVRDQPYYFLRTNLNSGDDSATNTITAFTATGFNIGANGGLNNSGDKQVAWCWKGGTTTGLSGGTITPSSYNINATAGIGTYKYSGTGSNGTIAHGLGAGKKFLVARRINTTGDWRCLHADLAAGIETLTLNTTASEYGEADVFNSTFPDDTVFSLGTDADTNDSGSTYIAFLFCETKGCTRVSRWEGTGNADGPFVWCGFRPAYILIKNINGTSDWNIIDDKRLGYNVDNNRLKANENSAESTGDYIDLLANGFKIRTASADYNTSGQEYMFVAFAKFPTVSSNDIPGVAR